MYSYDYPRPALTADIALFDLEGKRILLVLRGNQPYAGHWALPGGFFDMEDPSIEHTAARELEEETGLHGIPLRLLTVASREGRDPRGRTVSVAFLGTVNPEMVQPQGGDDAREARWFGVENLPPLAFDHEEIVQKALTFLGK